MDFKFDILNMDMVIENGDFVIETNPSIQNSGLILETKNFNSLFPTLGIGIRGVINSKIDIVYAFLNKWNRQVISDGAKSANWTIDENNKFITTCDYV